MNSEPVNAHKIFYGWWIVFACFFIGVYVGSVVFFGFTTFFNPIREEFGWSYTQISFAISLRGLEMGIFAPFVGFIVDRFGARRLIFYGTITVGFGLIFLSLTQSLAMFYASFLIIAFGAGGCAALVLVTAVAKWFDKNVGLALGVMGSGVGVGGLMIPLIVWLIDLYQWRPTLIILGLGMWVVGIPLSFIIRDRPEEYGYLPDGKLLDDSIPFTEIQDGQREIGLKEVLKKRSFLYLNIAELIRFMTFSAVALHIMPYLTGLGIPRSTAGLVTGAIPLCSIIGRIGFGWLGDIFDKRYVMAWTCSFMSVGMLALRYVHAGWVIPFFLLLYSPGFGGTMTLRAAILREYFGRDSFGKLIGILMGVGAIGGMTGPTLTGWVFDTMGSYSVIWLVYSGLIGLTTVLILRIK